METASVWKCKRECESRVVRENVLGDILNTILICPNIFTRRLSAQTGVLHGGVIHVTLSKEGITVSDSRVR
ncbi:hypothetical protein QE152_g37582 [Popillia japonica]|uniref:Uncharacterized protein n=1 Tax=Popillia japonica TaxID=7064 RepID=A0AAW1IA09_POPJA